MVEFQNFAPLIKEVAVVPPGHGWLLLAGAPPASENFNSTLSNPQTL